MKHVSVLPLYDSTLASIDSSRQLLSRINDFMRYQQRPGFYEIEVVGAKKTTNLDRGLYQIKADKTLRQVSKTDLIVIPLLCGDFTTAITKNQNYVEWVQTQYGKGAEIVCLCAGSFFLASTGMLDGRKCAVHWAAKDEFEKMFPEVVVVANTIITDEKGIYTSGGGFSFLNVLLYVIERHLGRDTAILASKMFEIDMERKNQNAFVIFMGQKQHGDDLVLQAQEFIESNPTSSFSVDEICERFSVGRRTFERRFKTHTNNSILEYVQRVKVEFVKKHLKQSRRTVNEIIYEAGYNDIDAFRKVFRKFTDLSPTTYRRKFSGEKSERVPE